MKVTEIWIRIFFISRTIFPFYPLSKRNRFGFIFLFCVLSSLSLFLSRSSLFSVNGLTFTLTLNVNWRFKMPLLPAEQIGSGRWFNDCFWHSAILLLHWISNISIVWLALCTYSLFFFFCLFALSYWSPSHSFLFIKLDFWYSVCFWMNHETEEQIIIVTVIIIINWFGNGECCVALLWLFILQQNGFARAVTILLYSNDALFLSLFDFEPFYIIFSMDMPPKLNVVAKFFRQLVNYIAAFRVFLEESMRFSH